MRRGNALVAGNVSSGVDDCTTSTSIWYLYLGAHIPEMFCSIVRHLRHLSIGTCVAFDKRRLAETADLGSTLCRDTCLEEPVL